jgi:hypothetical protein
MHALACILSYSVGNHISLNNACYGSYLINDNDVSEGNPA